MKHFAAFYQFGTNGRVVRALGSDGHLSLPVGITLAQARKLAQARMQSVGHYCGFCLLRGPSYKFDKYPYHVELNDHASAVCKLLGVSPVDL